MVAFLKEAAPGAVTATGGGASGVVASAVRRRRAAVAAQMRGDDPGELRWYEPLERALDALFGEPRTLRGLGRPAPCQ